MADEQAQRIDVPGIGLVEFPAGMSDADIETAINSFYTTKEFTPEKETTLGGAVGAATRGAGPYGVAAIAGGATGGPAGAVTAVTATGLSKFIGDPLVMGVNKALGTNLSTPTEALNKMFDWMGVERPDTATEQFINILSEGVASGPMSQGRSITGQMVSGGLAAGAGETARVAAEEAGLGAGWQLGASLLAGVGTGIVTMPGVTIKTAPLSIDEAAEATRLAAKGNPSAKATLAFHAADGIDPATKKAADDLGLSQYLTPGQMTTNKVVRELEESLAEFPTSSLRNQRVAAVDESLRRIDETMQSLSKDDVFDFSLVSSRTRDTLRTQIDGLDEIGEQAYKELAGTVNPQFRYTPSNTLAYLEQRIADLGGGKEGINNLSQMERDVYRRLQGKADMVDGVPQRVGPTYTAFDDVRRNVGQATRGKSDFKNQDVGQAKKLYEVMSADQSVWVREAGGNPALLHAAQAATKQRKAMEDQMIMLFGRELDKSMSSSLSGATVALSKGDAERWAKLMDAVPTQIRSEVAAGAVATMLTKGAKDGSLNLTGFTQWYEGVRRNKQAYRALLGSMTPEARTGLDNIYQIGRIITERSSKNNSAYIQSAVAGSTGLMHNMAMAGRRALSVIGFQSLIGSKFQSQAGSYALANSANAALMANKQAKALNAANRVYGSPEFRELVSAMADGRNVDQYVKKLAGSQMMLTFVRQANLSTKQEDIRHFIYQGIMPSESSEQ